MNSARPIKAATLKCFLAVVLLPLPGKILTTKIQADSKLQVKSVISMELVLVELLYPTICVADDQLRNFQFHTRTALHDRLIFL